MAPAAVVVESAKATGLWGLGMFVAALCSRKFGLSVEAATLAQRSGDFFTALLLIGPSLNMKMIRSQSPLGLLCGLSTGLITTGASTFYNRALVSQRRFGDTIPSAQPGSAQRMLRRCCCPPFLLLLR